MDTDGQKCDNHNQQSNYSELYSIFTIGSIIQITDAFLLKFVMVSFQMNLALLNFLNVISLPSRRICSHTSSNQDCERVLFDGHGVILYYSFLLKRTVVLR